MKDPRQVRIGEVTTMFGVRDEVIEFDSEEVLHREDSSLVAPVRRVGGVLNPRERRVVCPRHDLDAVERTPRRLEHDDRPRVLGIARDEERGYPVEVANLRVPHGVTGPDQWWRPGS